MSRRFRIGVIGFGRMGRGFVAEMLASKVWDVAYICDPYEPSREVARETCPRAKVITDPDIIFRDKSLDVVGIFTLADVRPGLIRKALKAKMHILAEKPLAADIDTEWKLVKQIEASRQLVAVNIFNRNAWYHHEMINFIRSGQIGELGIVRVCHMTPGHMPTEGHDPEGPPFHDCGMHYVDVARWYADSEFDTYHAQGIRMWSHTDPWWVQTHGTFKNGVVFDITQGFVYGHLAQKKIHNCYVEAIGSLGVCRMTHNFHTATIELHGVDQTIHKTAAFDDKKLDVMIDVFARSMLAGKNLGFPIARDSAIASEMAWNMLHDAVKNNPPAIGTQDEMRAILEHRRNLRDGYGLPVVKPAHHMPAQLVAPVSCGEEACCLPLPRGKARISNGAVPRRRDACY
ncbi:MAG: Gfo/Idh/MocA family protein [Phycisphaerales bacterium]